MSLMTWSDEYSVGIPSIDAQHKKLMDMINELNDGMKANHSKEVMGPILDKLIAYTVEHFGYEEGLFDKTGYALSAEHKTEHEKLKATAVDLQKRFQESQSGTLSIETSRFLRDWLLGHIQGSDMKYTEHFKQNGIA